MSPFPETISRDHCLEISIRSDLSLSLDSAPQRSLSLDRSLSRFHSLSLQVPLQISLSRYCCLEISLQRLLSLSGDSLQRLPSKNCYLEIALWISLYSHSPLEIALQYRDCSRYLALEISLKRSLSRDCSIAISFLEISLSSIQGLLSRERETKISQRSLSILYYPLEISLQRSLTRGVS